MSVSIRARLLLLVLAALLPALVGLGYFVAATYSAEREANHRSLRDSARALAMVVDLELRQRASIAQLLSSSRWLDDAPRLSAQDRQRFEQQARHALRGLDGWVELRTRDGVLLDTRGVSAATPGATRATAAAAPIGLSDRRFVQPLPASADAEHAYAALVEPVQRHGRTVANLALTILPSELQRMIDAQQLPPGWVAAVLDNHGRVVASQPDAQAPIGFAATAPVHAQQGTQAEGLFESVSAQGEPGIGYFSRTAQGWTGFSAMPRALYDGLLQRSVLQAVLGALGLLVLATIGALAVARRIAAPVHALRDAASQLQAGQPVAMRASGIVEVDAVGAALARAATTIGSARAELQRQVEQAVQHTREAEQLASQGQRVEALGRLTGGVAHDFNNLLGVVSNSVHLIERHPAADELQLPLAGIQRAVTVGAQLTQHLLRFAGQRPVLPRPITLDHYLSEVQQLLHSVLGKRIVVSTQVAPQTHAVRVDGGELELALINLALNARDAMPGGGELRLRARNAGPEDTAGLAGQLDKPYVLITVGDDGAGVEPQVAARAFEPFFTTKPVGKGSGLGLSQVLGFCVQAGGTARLHSTPGLGTTVSLLLPASTDVPPAPPPTTALADAAASTALVDARVLLVEDNVELAQLTVALLRANGMQLHHVTDATQALQLLAVPHAFDLVLSDVVMPGELDGIELAQRLRREQPELPLVLLSGYSDSAVRAPDFVLLRKPCSESDLLRALAHAMRR